MKSSKKMRLLARIVSMILAAVLLSEAFLADGNIVLAAEQEEIPETDAVEAPEEDGSTEETETTDEEYNTDGLDILFEVEENRNQSSKHYRLSDGSIMAADYGMDVHYRKNGEWKDIDNRFVYEAADAADAMEGFATAEGDVEFKFAPDTSSGEVVRAVYEDYSVSFEFLGTSGIQGSQSKGTADMSAAEQSASVDEIAAFMEEDLSENNNGQKTEPDDIHPGSKAVSRPITFIKGDLLNMEAAVQALAGTPAEETLSDLEETEVQGIPSVSSYLTGGDTAAVNSASSEDHAKAGTDTKDIWAEAGTENLDGSEKDSLMRQAALEHAVTSVGYEDILDGVSLQYVAAGSTLKEYILVSEPQDTYEYLFLLKLDNLIPASQSDGSIFLLDKENGETVYEIPAAYMTDAAGGYSDAVDVEIAKKAEGEYLLQISASKEWINDEERVFPVKIDPTLNKKLTSSANVRGNYVEQGHPNASSTNYGEMYVGYDSSGNKNMITYIQLKNLPTLPADSVVCSSVFNMAVLSFSQVAWPRLTIQAKEVKNTSWNSAYTWNSRPSSESLVIDHKTITSSELYKYVGWDITSLVKAHYDAGNETDAILAFSLEAYGTMSNLKCANTALNLLWNGAEPLFQIFYRDTRGIEDYYTYQNQSLGHAGTGYISDYNSQLVVAKTVASYDATDTPFSVGLVYNSANSGKYFSTDSEMVKLFCNTYREKIPY